MAGPGQWTEAEIQKAQTIMGTIVGFTADCQNIKVATTATLSERLIAWVIKELMRYRPEYALRYVLPWLSSRELRMTRPS